MALGGYDIGGDMGNLRAQNIFNAPRRRDPYENITFGGGSQGPVSPYGDPYGGLFQTPELGVRNLAPSSNEPTSDWITRLNQLYKPETEATSRFNQLLDAPPIRENPSVARKLTAMMGGLGGAFKGKSGEGFTTSKTILEEPFTRATAEWKTKAEPYYQAANLERQSNINERQLLGQGVTASIAQQKADETERRNRESADVNRERIISNEKIQLERNQLNRMKNEGWEFDFKGAYVMAYRQGDPTPRNTGVKTGNLSEADKLELTYGYARKMEDTRQGNRIELKETPAAGAARTPEAERDARNNLYRQVWDARPDLRKWIEPQATAGGNYSLKDPPVPGNMPWSWGQKDLDSYNEARKLLGLSPIGGTPTVTPPMGPPAPPPGKQPIGGNNTPPRGASQGTPTNSSATYPATAQGGGGIPVVPPNATNMQRNKTTGEVRYSTDGGKTWITLKRQ